MTTLRSEVQQRLVAAHLVALATLPGIGPGSLLRWHRGVGAEAAWRTVREGRADPIRRLAGSRVRLKPAGIEAMAAAARRIDPEECLERQLEAGCQVLVLGQRGYPSRLAQDPAPPAVLFARGDLSVADGPTVAIVGTRNATRLGRDLAAQLGQELAEKGVAVVSGLALGIDAAAHRGAVHPLVHPGAPAADGAPIGRPIGVIASGLDIAYPRRHADLHQDIARLGLLVSEVPAGERPSEWRFPARNRIIAGLADAVVVVESRSAGGSMLTAGEALDRAVPVLAVPGHPLAPASTGTNDLLFDGATMVRSSRDVFDAIGLLVDHEPAVVAPRDRRAPDAAGRIVLDAIGDQPSALAEVVSRCELELEDVARTLVTLEATGHVVRHAGWFERSARGRSAS